MKFVHIADLHFDCEFSGFKNDVHLIEKRKLEQREAFRKVIDYINDESVEYLFISGDLYENEHVKKSTIEFINNLFKKIPNTKIFISPGNHDPNIKGSIYDEFKFNDNVKIFKNSKIEKYEDDNIEVYGAGFEDFYMNKNLLDEFELKESNKSKFLVIHADLNGVLDMGGCSYNPINELKLKTMGFDYVALGHIHKTNFNSNNRIIYPGSLISLGFDELGCHGMVVGKFSKKNIVIEFQPIDVREFVEYEVNVEDMSSQSDLIDYLTTLYFEKNKFCKIVLKGKRKFFINIKDIMYLIDNSSIYRIKDETILGYDLENLAKEKNLKGIFVRKLLEMKNNSIYSEEEIEKAIEIGLEAMDS